MDKTGGQAFPSVNPRMCIDNKNNITIYDGMTLRDYFAGQALIGLASQIPVPDIYDIAEGTRGGKYYIKASFVLADAMIKERSNNDTKS